MLDINRSLLSQVSGLLVLDGFSVGLIQPRASR